MKKNIHYSKNGFSLVEIVLAIAIFMILAVVGITTSFSVNKLSSEQLFADLYAQEGIEAIRSIKNRGWSNLAVGTYGLSSSTGVWAFSGNEDSRDKYTRQIIVSGVQRDVNGNIVASGGVIDVDTLKIDSEVNWNFSGPRNDTVKHSTFLTNFKKTKEGILFYGGAVSPKWRNYSNTSDSFDSEKIFSETVSGRNYAIRSSPVKMEAVAGVVTSGGELRVYCYDGSWNGLRMSAETGQREGLILHMKPIRVTLQFFTTTMIPIRLDTGQNLEHPIVVRQIGVVHQVTILYGQPE